MESFPNLTFTMIEHFCNLSVIELCFFLKEWACTCQKQGGIEGAICIFSKEGVIDIFSSGHTVQLICYIIYCNSNIVKKVDNT